MARIAGLGCVADGSTVDGSVEAVEVAEPAAGNLFDATHDPDSQGQESSQGFASRCTGRRRLEEMLGERDSGREDVVAIDGCQWKTPDL